MIKIEDEPGYRGSAAALAYSTPYADSGICIHILADRMRRAFQVETSNVDFQSTDLAHVMAHEITHVLEGVMRHSDTWIMKAMWSEADYREMKQHPPLFAHEDVTLIHDSLGRHAPTHIQRPIP